MALKAVLELTIKKYEQGLIKCKDADGPKLNLIYLISEHLLVEKTPAYQSLAQKGAQEYYDGYKESKKIEKIEKAPPPLYISPIT